MILTAVVPQPAGSRNRATLERVAEAAGVTRATVSRVVNGWTSVAPTLRERVERAVAELGYAPYLAARSLVTCRSDTLALVASEPDARVFGYIFDGDATFIVDESRTVAGPETTVAILTSVWFEVSCPAGGRLIRPCVRAGLPPRRADRDHALISALPAAAPGGHGAIGQGR